MVKKKTEPMEEKEEAKVEESPLCGHVNAHYTGEEVMACVLLAGHAGNHQAPYLNRGNPQIAEWKDAAGTPVKKHGSN